MTPKKISVLLLLASFVLLPTFLKANDEETQYRLKEITPSVQSALDGRKSRHAEIRDLKAKGLLGEDNQGYIQMLKPSTDAARVVDPENNDRSVIYDAIAKQNQLGPKASAQVQRAFVEVKRERAESGDYYQTDSGKWVQK